MSTIYQVIGSHLLGKHLEIVDVIEPVRSTILNGRLGVVSIIVKAVIESCGSIQQRPVLLVGSSPIPSSVSVHLVFHV